MLFPRRRQTRAESGLFPDACHELAVRQNVGIPDPPAALENDTAISKARDHSVGCPVLARAGIHGTARSNAGRPGPLRSCNLQLVACHSVLVFSPTGLPGADALKQPIQFHVLLDRIRQLLDAVLALGVQVHRVGYL